MTHKVGENNYNWKGGRYLHKQGYVCIFRPDHPHSNSNGYVFEHQLVLEEYLGRYLEKGKTRKDNEIPHHCNEKKADNRIENLDLRLHGEHTGEHWLGKKHSPGTKEKIGNASRGRTHTQETKDKCKIASRKSRKMKGRKHSPETKEKMKGRKHSPETKEKMKEAQKKRWVKRKLSSSKEELK